MGNFAHELLQRARPELLAVSPCELLAASENPFLRAKLLTFNLNLLRARGCAVRDDDLFGFVGDVLTQERVIELARAVEPTQELPEMIARLISEMENAKGIIHWFWAKHRFHDAFKRSVLDALQAKTVEFTRLAEQHVAQNGLQ